MKMISSIYGNLWIWGRVIYFHGYFFFLYVLFWQIFWVNVAEHKEISKNLYCALIMMHFDCASCCNILRNLTNSDEIILVQNIPDGVIRIQYGGAFGLPYLVHLLLGMPRPGLGFVVPPQGLLPEPRDLLGPFTRDGEPVSSNSHGQLHRGL